MEEQQKPPVIMIKKADRECGECTACCSGTLSGSAYGQMFWGGRPCHFVSSKGCTIYEDRPENPCKSYSCEWLVNPNIPEWMKPNESGVIITPREKNGHYYWSIAEITGRKMPAEVVSWLFIEHIKGKTPNLQYQVNGGWNLVGTMEFHDSMLQ